MLDPDLQVVGAPNDTAAAKAGTAGLPLWPTYYDILTRLLLGRWMRFTGSEGRPTVNHSCGIEWISNSRKRAMSCSRRVVLYVMDGTPISGLCLPSAVDERLLAH